MTLLKVDDLSKEFGGVHAIEDLSFVIEPGTIHAIIGPNGAGKTTLFNLITGVYTPSAGEVYLDDRPVTGKAPFELARAGMSRTFQNLQVCLNMSALDNVMLGRHMHLKPGFVSGLLRLPGVVRRDREARQMCAGLMDFVGLGNHIHAAADSLPYGALKRLEIARALAAEPRLLLLDEPAAGLNSAETREIDAVIQKVAERGVTVVLVEHDMKLVMGISDHVLVLDYGRKLAEGRPQDIRANPDVIAAYLGTAHAFA
ncbi:ABC transporter ATP-binding protein [Roseospirillum parvum]|uniref:Branched-chain amino acid transport system ATP-binding protein n=1 Tax=Roseospirillum parvum TaxID=83401 RepID=A0A1G8E494_9PROT|nr:ABC transporter ATP-binding protein [Roseospirillum parvum]SDH64704.1 branched-chain amino acid transport system ATP-binding protein [Roseospirillum parvum]